MAGCDGAGQGWGCTAAQGSKKNYSNLVTKKLEIPNGDYCYLWFCIIL
jgi:hypothetical protein